MNESEGESVNEWERAMERVGNEIDENLFCMEWLKAVIKWFHKIYTFNKQQVFVFYLDAMPWRRRTIHLNYMNETLEQSSNLYE